MWIYILSNYYILSKYWNITFWSEFWNEKSSYGLKIWQNLAYKFQNTQINVINQLPDQLSLKDCDYGFVPKIRAECNILNCFVLLLNTRYSKSHKFFI